MCGAQRGNSYMIMPTRTPVWSLDWTPQPHPMQPLGYSRCPGNRDNQEPLIPGESDFILCTKFGNPPGFHWHYVSLILSQPTGLPWLQVHWLVQLPFSQRRSNSVQSGIAQWDGYLNVRWKHHQRHSEGSGSVHSQASTASRPTAPDTGWHSGWYTPEEPAAVAVAYRQGHRSESRGQPIAEVGERQAQRVEKRPMELQYWIPRSWRPPPWRMTKRAMRFPTPSLLGHPRGNRFLGIRERRNTCTQSGDSVSAGDRSFGPGNYRDGWVGAEVLLLKPCQRTPVKNSDEIHEAIRGLKDSKAPGPKHIPNRALKHFPTRAVSLLTHIFNAVLRTYYFPQARKHARLISILSTGRSQYCPVPIDKLVSWTRLVNYLKSSY